MSKLNKASFLAKKDQIFADNVTENITPEDFRVILEDIGDSLAFIDDQVTIEEVWTHTEIVKGIEPIADEDLATKKYVDDNAGIASGDVVGPGSSIDNQIVVFDGLTGKIIKGGTGVVLSQSGDLSGLGNLSFSSATKQIAGIQVGNLLDSAATQNVTGAWTFDDISVPTPTASTDAATKQYVDDNVGGGDVLISGTPVNNQLAIWTSANTIEGDPNLTWSGSVFSIGGTFSANIITVDNLMLDGNTISSTSGNLNFSPVSATNALSLAATTGNATFSGDVINSGDILSATSTSSLVLSGDTVKTTGANIRLFGASSGSANQLQLRQGSTVILNFEDGGNAIFVEDVKIRGGATDATTGAGALSIKDSSDAPFISFHNDAGVRGGFLQYNNSTPEMRLQSNTGGEINLAVGNNVALGIDSSSNAVFSNNVTATDFILSSDIRHKEVLGQLGGDAVKYIKYKREDGRERTGVSAQQLQKIHPEMVVEGADGKLAVSYIDLMCSEIVRLENKINKLENARPR